MRIALGVPVNAGDNSRCVHQVGGGSLIGRRARAGSLEGTEGGRAIHGAFQFRAWLRTRLCPRGDKQAEAKGKRTGNPARVPVLLCLQSRQT